MGKIDWDVVTAFADTVTTTLKTVTFPKVQEAVYLRNQGNANFTYTIGTQSGTLIPGQSVTVKEDVSSFTIQAVSGTHTFELRANEKGTEKTETETDVMSLLADIATNVKLFGAVGDNLHDDTLAIQSALDYCYTNNLVLYFPIGIYKVTNTLYLPSIVKIKGASPVSPRKNSSLPSCRINFTKANAALFVKKGYDANGNNIDVTVTDNNIVLFLEKINFIYNDILYASNTLSTSSTVFRNISLIEQSIIQHCEFRSFNYVFENCALGGVTRILNNSARELGVSFLYGSMVDTFIRDNYFNGSLYAQGGAKLFDITYCAMSSISENWFEFCEFALKGSNANHTTILNNTYDYCYRAVDGFSADCTVSTNLINHSSKGSALSRFANPSSNMNSDVEWINIHIAANKGINISDNTGVNSDILILIDGFSFRDIKTQGNQNVPDDDSVIFAPEKTVTINLPKTGYMVNHGKNIDIQELNFSSSNTLPNSNLFPTRKVYLNNKSIVLGNDFKWVDSNGDPAGFKTKNLLPKLNDSSWGITADAKWTVASDGYSVTATGFTTSSWINKYSIGVPVVSGDLYRFNTKTPKYASDGTTQNVIEIYFFQGGLSGTKLSTLYYDQSNGDNQFAIPTNADTMQFALRFPANGTSTIVYKFDTLTLTKFSSNEYGKIVNSANGVKFLTYTDDAGAVITEKFS